MSAGEIRLSSLKLLKGHMVPPALVLMSRLFPQFIPMPVLYGVFLYMGASSLKGIQVELFINHTHTHFVHSLCAIVAVKILTNGPTF